LEEFFEVLTWAQLGLHAKPCGLLNVQGFFDGLLSFLDHSIDEGFVRRENRSILMASSSPGEARAIADGAQLILREAQATVDAAISADSMPGVIPSPVIGSTKHPASPISTPPSKWLRPIPP
jgi:hypothetical protein